MPNEETNTAKEMLAAGAALSEGRVLIPDGKEAPAIVIPQGYQLVIPDISKVEPWLSAPLRKRGQFKFADSDSFIRYFNEHKTQDSRIFADISDETASFTGRLDFHGDKPTHGEHSCTFALEPTHEWKVWIGNNKKHMAQGDFALFLEDNADMFKEPDGADLLELIQTLEGKSHVNISQAIKLSNGQLKVNYNEEVELKGVATNREGQMEVPVMLSVSISPFIGTGFYDMKARLRHRIADRRITFWYETVAPHMVVRAISSELLGQIEKQTGVSPFKV